MKTKKEIKMCCYCGVEEATTKDHIPPKSIFTRPRPSDLITVPCCFKCNNDASKTDEGFMAYLGMHVARQGGEAERLFKEAVLATAKHNNKLRKTILQSMSPIEYTANSGEVRTGAAVPWDNEAHDATIDRMIRGLFFYHYGKIIADRVKITTYWLNKPIDHFDEKLYTNSIASGLFKYQYNKAIDAEFDSMWLFNFYEGHFAGGIVGGPDE